MSEIIQLLTVENTLSRKKHPGRQDLEFLIQVADLDYAKQVDVVWAGQNGIWHTLAAVYLMSGNADQEYWRAQTTLYAENNHELPGVIRFALRVRAKGTEFWDNNQGLDYTSTINTGIALREDLGMQNLSLTNQLEDGQQWVTIKIAVNPAFAAESVVIHWTIDNWRHRRHTQCRVSKQNRKAKTRIWSARIRIGDAFRLHYSICCKSQNAVFWDNNNGANYIASHSPLKVMILNLHCYQEEDQYRKFNQIAAAIDEQAVDVVCLQEVAEHWNHGHGDWASNSANIINQRLKHSLHLFSDWSHLGFDKYREGVAILSRYDLHNPHATYVSDSHDVYNINSRKVVMARITTRYFGNINIFSAHLSWLEGGFQQQFQRLRAWADELAGHHAVKTTMLCGDFNITAGSAGYRQVVETQHYEDQYLAANTQGLFNKFFRVNDPHWRDYPTDDYRIDYIFMNKDSNLRVTSARVLFTEQDYGRVSDHCGYLMTFEPK
jgi:maltose 6'-phosphate phosphatase